MTRKTQPKAPKAWTARSLATATRWSRERAQGWLDGLHDHAAGHVQPYRSVSREEHASDLRLKDPLSRWAFGYEEAIRYAERRVGRTSDPWEGITQEEMIQEANAWWGAGDDNRDVPDPEDCAWRYVTGFPLEAFVARFGGIKDCISWFRAECRDAMRDGRDGYGYLVVQEQQDPIVVTIVDGKPLIWDGWHRLAAAIVRWQAGIGSGTVKAVIGEPKPALTPDAPAP